MKPKLRFPRTTCDLERFIANKERACLCGCAAGSAKWLWAAVRYEIGPFVNAGELDDQALIALSLSLDGRPSVVWPRLARRWPTDAPSVRRAFVREPCAPDLWNRQAERR